MKDAGKFNTDIATTDNDYPFGQAFEVERFVRSDGKFGARNRWYNWPSSGRDENIFGGEAFAA